MSWKYQKDTSNRGTLGVPKPGCFKPGCLRFLCINGLLRPSASFKKFCALLGSFADLRLRSFADICALLRSFACFCEGPRLEQPRLGTPEYSGRCLKGYFGECLFVCLGVILNSFVFCSWSMGPQAAFPKVYLWSLAIGRLTNKHIANGYFDFKCSKEKPRDDPRPPYTPPPLLVATAGKEGCGGAGHRGPIPWCSQCWWPLESGNTTRPDPTFPGTSHTWWTLLCVTWTEGCHPDLCSDLSSDFPIFFRFVPVHLYGTCSDLLRFLLICSVLFSEQIRTNQESPLSAQPFASRRSIAVSGAVENRDLYRVFISCLFKGVWHTRLFADVW